MPTVSAAAARYARAFFRLAEERQTLDTVQADVEALRGLLADCPEFAAFVGNPVVPPARRLAAVQELFQGRLHPSSLHFLSLLVEKRRLAELPAIIEQFLAFCREKAGIVRATVVSAQPLDDGQRERLLERLQARLGRRVEATLSVEASLIGGFTVQVGDEVIDMSIASRLQAFQNRVLAS